MKIHISPVIRQRFISGVERVVPVGFRRAVARIAFFFSRNAVFLAYAAKLWEQSGRTERALEAYHRAERALNTALDHRKFDLRQATQFSIQCGLHRLGEPTMAEPFAACLIEPGTTPVGRHKGVGSFDAWFTFHGLRIAGRVLAGSGTKAVEVVVNDTVIRREKVRMRGSGADFIFAVKRHTIRDFPNDVRLVVRIDGGESLTVRGSDHLHLSIPHGNGSLVSAISARGTLSKKGTLVPSESEVQTMQDDFLRIYEAGRTIFEREIGRPLLVMFGSLLGLYRDGDFIPGDDDFDAVYVTDLNDPAEIRREARYIMETLIRNGMTVLLNRVNKPFRLLERNGIDGRHIDVCPVWSQDGYVWAPPFGRLTVGLDTFVPAVKRDFRGTEVLIPCDAEAVLADYYGPGWRVPDPTYSATTRRYGRRGVNRLRDINFTPAEVLDFKHEMDRMPGDETGSFHGRAIHDLYPLEEYEKHCGW